MGSDAWAQTAGAPGSTNPMTAMLVQLGYFLPIFVIIYLIAIHPQRQRQKQLDKMIKELKKGDKVLTSGGIIGTVIGLDDSKAVLRIAEDTKVEFSKSSIVQVLAAGDAK
jgi:preprotein translocase subunit YajC